MRILFCLMAWTIYLPATAASSDKEYIVDRLEWQKVIKNDTTINIKNLHGNIHIKKTNDYTFRAHAVAQNHHSRSQKAHITSNHSDGNIDLTTTFSSEVIDKERIDLAILVPENVTLNITMDGDKLQGKKLNFPLKVTSESADIQLSTDNAFDLFSKTGEINVKLNNRLQDQSSSVQTHTGDVVIRYGKTIPYFKVVSGLEVVSNTADLLSSKTKNKRQQSFNDPNSQAKISIVSDTGRVVLLH